MQARLPPVSAGVGGEPTACGVFAGNRGLSAAPIACTFRHTPMIFERNFEMNISKLCGAAACLFMLPMPAAAGFGCDENDAFMECRRKLPDSNDFSQLNDCIAIELAACQVTTKLLQTARNSLSEEESVEIKKCAFSAHSPDSSLTHFDCLNQHLEKRANAVYTSFLAENNVTDPNNFGLLCTRQHIAPERIRECLEIFKYRFRPVESGD